MSTTNETNTEIGGIEYNKNYIYSQNDVDTRLIDVLGNLKKLEAAGAKGLIEGECRLGFNPTETIKIEEKRVA